MPSIAWFANKPPVYEDMEGAGWKRWFHQLWRYIRGDNRVNTTVQTASFTPDEDFLYFVDSDAGNVVVTLPLASLYNHKRYCIVRHGDPANNITFANTGSDTIEGGATAPFLPFEGDRIVFQSDGVSTWWILNHSSPEYCIKVANISATAQSAAVAATTVYAVPASGQGWYRVSYRLAVTTAASTSSVLGGTSTGPQTLYTDPVDSVVKTTNAGAAFTNGANTTAAACGRVDTVYAKASTNIQYSIGYTSVGGTAMQYDYNVLVEYLGP